MHTADTAARERNGCGKCLQWQLRRQSDLGIGCGGYTDDFWDGGYVGLHLARKNTMGVKLLEYKRSNSKK